MLSKPNHNCPLCDHSAPSKTYLVPAYVNGKEVQMQLSESMYNSLKSLASTPDKSLFGRMIYSIKSYWNALCNFIRIFIYGI